MKTGWMICDRGHRWRALKGDERRAFVAELLQVPAADLDPEDVAQFGDECPRCGRMGASESYRRVWR